MRERDPACGMAWLDDYKMVTVNGISVICLAGGEGRNNEPRTKVNDARQGLFGERRGGFVYRCADLN